MYLKALIRMTLIMTCPQVSVRLSYRLDDWAGYTWMIDPPDLDLFTM